VNLEIWHYMLNDGESSRDVMRDVRDNCTPAA
jgi:hypothetical protein